METTFKCYYCDSHSVIFGDINHSIDIHESEILKIRIESTTETYTRKFTINPKEEHGKGKVIIPNDETRTIKISKLLQTPSPMVKLSKNLKHMSHLLQRDLILRFSLLKR